MGPSGRPFQSSRHYAQDLEPFRYGICFDPSEMESPSHMQGRLARLWGDLLQMQSRKQLGQLFSGRIEG